MKSIRLLIADDHSLVRASIRRLVQEMDDVEVVGEAVNGRDVVAKAEQLNPDLVLMDILMPELNGLDAARTIVNRKPAIAVIFLSMHANPEYVRQAKKLGARGFVLKDASAEEIHRAIREIVAGRTWFASTTAEDAAPSPMGAGGHERLFEVLSPRQREVLQLLVEGNSTRRIAEKMSITEHTVEKHRERIMASLDIHDIAGLVRFALRSGLTQSNY